MSNQSVQLGAHWFDHWPIKPVPQLGW